MLNFGEYPNAANGQVAWEYDVSQFSVARILQENKYKLITFWELSKDDFDRRVENGPLSNEPTLTRHGHIRHHHQTPIGVEN